jgi:hypothetical protein
MCPVFRGSEPVAVAGYEIIEEIPDAGRDNRQYP